MNYFAYGSNLDWNQMRERCPSAHFRAKAMLPDHKLAFSRESNRRGCGVADVVPFPGGSVWGVIYDLSDHDLPKLDRCEGFQEGRATNAYFRRECIVRLESDPQQKVAAWTYFAGPHPNPPRPNSAYMAHLLTGARHWRLPESYIRELEQVETSE